jgi:hypothetical protein
MVSYASRTRTAAENASAPKQSADRETYVPPFNLITRGLGLNHTDLASGKNITIPVELFKFLMGSFIARGFFDERWYLETYPDVEAAINRGGVSTALEHYVNAGYYEGRSPGPCFVDRAWYEQYYKDLHGALQDGVIVDSAEHFQHNGYFEGRVAVPDQLPSREKWHILLREEDRDP